VWTEPVYMYHRPVREPFNKPRTGTPPAGRPTHPGTDVYGSRFRSKLVRLSLSIPSTPQGALLPTLYSP
jgi:hypothetical protein